MTGDSSLSSSEVIPLAISLLAHQTDAHSFVGIQRLAPNVYAAVRKEPPGLAVDANVLIIERKKDVVLVDANIGPESANGTLDAIGRISKKPVGAVIATHYHDDHMGGFATIRARFPNVELIAHKSSPGAIQDLLRPARHEMIQAAPQMSKFLRGLIDGGKSFSGGAITDEEKASYENDIRIADRYAREMKDIPLPKPTRLVGDRLVLKEGGKTIEILHLGAGHTPSDLVVWLPKERIVAVGDLVVWPVPLVGGPQSDVLAWPKTLEKVRALKPKAIMPGHGPILRDDSYLKSMESFFAAVTRAVRKLKPATVQEAQKGIAMEAEKRSFCGDSKLRLTLFEEYARKPSIASAFRLMHKRS